MTPLSSLVSNLLGNPPIKLIRFRGEPWARVRGGDGAKRVLSVRDKSFIRWTGSCIQRTKGVVPSRGFVRDIVEAIAAEAVNIGEDRPVFVRVGEHKGVIYLDLGDSGGRAVRIDASGWRVIKNPPVLFSRPRGFLRLPRPRRGGTIADFRPFVHVSDTDFVLLIGWLISIMHPAGPYPILLVSGEAGGGKTFMLRLVRLLIDPNEADLRAEFLSVRDVMIGASNSWLVALDNMPRIPTWLSDAFCRLTHGAAFSTRALFTDSDEMLFAAKRPIAVNGIGSVAERGDLLERSISLKLPAISGEVRKNESDLMKGFLEVRPKILGALCTALCEALRNLPTTTLSESPRMADSVRLVTAAEPALGWPTGTFLGAYKHNQRSADELAIDASAIGPSLLHVLSQTPTWIGTAEELLADLCATLMAMKIPSPVGWPRSPRGLRDALDRISPNLRRSGWKLSFYRQAHGRRMIRIGFSSKGSGDGGAGTVTGRQYAPIAPCPQQAALPPG